MNEEADESTNLDSSIEKASRPRRSGLPPVLANDNLQRFAPQYSDGILQDLEMLAQAVPSNIFDPVLEYWDSVRKQFDIIYADWSRQSQELVNVLGSLGMAFWPDNLRAVKQLDLEDVYQLPMVEGITLYAVPRSEIVEALLEAKDETARRQILARKQVAIIADCKAALANCRNSNHKEYLDAAFVAIKAFEAGHVQAAQALFGSLCDTLFSRYFHKTLKRVLTAEKWEGDTQTAYDQLLIGEYLAFAVMRKAYGHYFPNEGQPIPKSFNRHATAHTVSPIQFTRLNTIQAMMAVTGILAFVEANGFPANRS